MTDAAGPGMWAGPSMSGAQRGRPGLAERDGLSLGGPDGLVVAPTHGRARPTKTEHPDIGEVLISEQEIADKVAEMARAVDADYAGRRIETHGRASVF